MLATMAMDGFLAMCEWLWLWIFGAHCQRMLLTSCRQAGSRQPGRRQLQCDLCVQNDENVLQAATRLQVSHLPLCVYMCVCVACGLTRSRTGTATATATGTATGTGRIVIIICASGIGLFMGLWVRQRRFVTNRFTGKSVNHKSACQPATRVQHAACSYDAA